MIYFLHFLLSWRKQVLMQVFGKSGIYTEQNLSCFRGDEMASIPAIKCDTLLHYLWLFTVAILTYLIAIVIIHICLVTLSVFKGHHGM
jgi:hypothetical protein